MKQTITEVYELDELSSEAKETAREWYRNGNDMPFLSEYMNEELQTILEKHGMKCTDAKVFYSLAYCQGDGAMFEGRVEWQHKGKEYVAHVKQSGHYYHYNSKTFELREAESDEEADEEAYKAFNEDYVDACRELERAGYKFIEYENEDAQVDENIRANEYTFTATGKRFG